MKPSIKTPVVALAGNPNVGKSTVFNSLTGSHQHTGYYIYTKYNRITSSTAKAKHIMQITKRAVTASDDESLVNLLEIVVTSVGQARSQCENPSKRLEKQIIWIKAEILQRMRESTHPR